MLASRASSLAFAVLALLAPLARAGTLTYLSLEDLARRSDACVVARVVDARVGWNADHTIIVTTYALEPLSVLAGDVAPGPLTLARVGGEVDGIALAYDGMPELTEGETAVLFLRERAPATYVTSGLRQGVLRAQDGAFVRDLTGVSGAPAPTERLGGEEIARRVRSARAVPEPRP